MGSVIVTEFVSIDGVMEAPGGEEGYRHTAWTFESSPAAGPWCTRCSSATWSTSSA
jgi:hypothetical protein